MREHAYIILVEKPYAKRPLSKSKRRWQDNLNWSQTKWENTAGFNWPRRRTLGSLWIGTESSSSVAKGNSWARWGSSGYCRTTFRRIAWLVVCLNEDKSLVFQMSCALHLTGVTAMKWRNASVNKYK
jgi:hypothetical protein